MPLSKNYELGTLANTLDIDQSTGEITSLTIDTDVVSEGANLYFTNERVDDRVAALIQAGTNITVAYDDVLGTLTINASDTEDDLSNNTTSDLAEGTNLYYTNARADARIAAASIDALTDVDITTSAPSSGQSLVWDNVNSKFIPGDSFSQSDFDTAFAAKSTTNLSEGTNLYYTNARADARIAAADTDALSEGSTNLYYTDARADARIAAATTTDLTEGTNLYYTDARADARAQLKIDALVDSAPNTLDTLNELASALGDDANFSTTITNSIATKLATADFNSTFDTRLGTRTTANLTEGTNLYFTNARADARIAAADTDDLSEGSTNLYFTNARADARIALQAGANLDLSSKSTSDLSEGTNLYYTNARVDAHLNQSNPTSGYVLSWNGSDYAWIDNTGYTAFNTDFDTRLGTKTTANLTEGSNLYYTNARADARVDAGFTAKSTSDLSEGTNLYYTNARADARIALQVGSNLDLSSKDTNSLSEGSNNLYYTNARADARVNLQTGSNLNLSSKDTDDLSEGSNNLYFTNARVQGTAINAGSLRGTVNNATVQYGTSYSGTPAQGSFFFDSLNAKLKVYNGSAFVDAVPGGGGGGGGGGASDAVATFRKYTFDISSTTNSVSGKDSVVVTAGSFVTGYQYQIISVGNTDFTAIGASGNTVGVTFTATGAGSGTGTAGHILNYATSNQNVEVYRNGAKMVEGSSDDYVASTGTSVNFTYNLQSGDVVEVQVYELLTSDAYYLKTETYTQTQTNSQISTAVAGYLPLSGGVLTNDLAINNGSPELYFGTTGNHYNWRIAAQEAVDAAFEIAVGSQDTDYSNDTYTPKLIVKANGNVGIGTTGPGFRLHAYHATTNVVGKIESGDDEVWLALTDVGTDSYGTLIGRKSSTNTLFKVADENVNERFTILEGGNVGIGTTSPQQILHIHNSSGNFSAEAVLTGRLSTGTPKAEVAFKRGTSGDGAMLVLRSSNSSGALIDAVTIKDGTGNVGIGDTDPAEKFTIKGDGARMTISSNDYEVAMLGRRGSTAPNWDRGYLRMKYDGANTIVLDTGGVSYLNGGNVGIGTAAPTSKLHIVETKSTTGSGQALLIDYNVTEPAADFAFAQYIDVDASGSGATGGDREQGGLRINLNSTTTGGNTTDEHRVYGIHLDTAISGDADVVNGIYTRALSNLSSGTTTNLFGIDAYAEADNAAGTTISNAVGVRGNAYIDNAGSSATNAYGGQFRTYQYTDGGSVTAAHGVYGELELNNTTAGNNYTTGYAFRALIDNNTSRADAIGTSYLYYGSYSGTVPTNAYGVFITDDVPNYFAGDVGIGTNNPERPLHVKGANAFVRIESTSASQNSQLDIKSTAATWSIGQNQVLANTGTLEFYNGSSSPVVIKTNGNVGIGVTSPESKLNIGAPDKGVGNLGMLHTQGVIETQGGSPTSMTTTDGVNGILWRHDGWGVQNTDTGNRFLAYLANSDASLIFAGNDFSTKLTIAQNGNVGIGTTNPTNTYGPALHIRGTNPNLRLDGTGSGSWAWISMNTADAGDSRAMGTASDGTFRITNVRDNLDSGIQFAIKQNGNVGIGTTSPAAKLAIAGGSTGAVNFLEFHYDDPAGDLDGLGNEEILVNYKFTDANANNTPQVQVAAELGNPGHTDEGMPSEGRGNYVVRTNDGATGGLSDSLRVEWDGSVHMPQQPAALYYDITENASVAQSELIGFATAAGWNRGITDSNSKTRFTVPTAGIYAVAYTVAGSLTTPSAGDGIRVLIKKNGATYANANAYNIETVGTVAGQEYTFRDMLLVDLGVNHYIELMFDNVGGTVFLANFGNINIWKVA